MLALRRRKPFDGVLNFIKRVHGGFSFHEPCGPLELNRSISRRGLRPAGGRAGFHKIE